MMHNFGKETNDELRTNGKTWDDVVFIGSSDGKFGITPYDFQIMSQFRYDDGFGGAEIHEDLVIVFKDGTWLERGEYDGSEWWEYKKCPVVPDSYTPIETLKEEDGDRYGKGRYLKKGDDDD